MIRKQPRLAVYGALCVLLSSLPGCTPYNMLDTGIFTGDKADLTETSNAAADMMIQQVRLNLKHNEPIYIEPLMALNTKNVRSANGLPRDMPIAPAAVPMQPETDLAPPFGTLISGQVAARFAQLGLNVTGPAAPRNISSATLGGYYARAHGRVLVTLRLTNSSSGMLLASYDYSMPLTREIQDLMGTDQHSFRLFDF